MKKMLEKLTGDKLIIVIFLIYLGVSGIISALFLMRKYVYNENFESEYTSDMGDKLEADYNSVFLGKQHYINLNGLCGRLFGETEINGVTKLRNGYLTVIDSDSNTDIVIENANSVIELSDYLNGKGIELIYVIAPSTVSKYDSQLPAGITDYTNYKLDVFAENLKRSENINLIDLREEMFNDGIDQYKLFYKTDHHWNVRGGLYAAQKIVERIEDICGEKLDKEMLNIENYNIEEYKKWHLGSRGQRVGRFFAGIDDFEIMYPKFYTEIERKSDKATGTFKDVFICYDALKNKDYASRYTYDTTYKYSIENSFINSNAPSSKRLLVLTDSMGRVVNPYLALEFNELDGIVYETVNQKLIDEIKSDVMIILLHPGNVFERDYFEFDV